MIWIVETWSCKNLKNLKTKYFLQSHFFLKSFYLLNVLSLRFYFFMHNSRWKKHLKNNIFDKTKNEK